MKITFCMACILFILLNSIAAEAADDNSVSMHKLEQRITELESTVQLLLKSNEQQSALLSVKNNHLITPEKKFTTGVPINNQDNTFENSLAINSNVDSSSETEIIIDLYQDLSEEINSSLKISGYADVEYKGSSEEGVNEEFRMHHLSLFFTKQFDNKIKFFSEIEYEDAPKFEGENDGSGELETAAGKIFVEALNFDWNYSQNLNVRVGRFFTPAGIWSEDHYPPFVTTQERPLHIRKIFPQLVDGISIFGSSELTTNHFFNYTAYLGNGESNVSGKKDLNSSKGFGFKGDYHAPWLDDFTLGFSLYRDNNDSANNDAEKFAYGYHINLRKNNFSLQGEYAKQELDFVDILEDNISEGYYAQLLYQFEQWGVGYRFDVFNETELDIDQTTRNSLFVNYHLNEYFTLKGEYHQDSYEDSIIDDYSSYILSVTGYLGR